MIANDIQNELSPEIAKRMIQDLGGTGQPPKFGIEYFSVGLDDYLGAINQEYLGPSGTLKAGGSSFKLVEAYYGGGKTHFFYALRDLAWQNNFTVAHIELHRDECPFDKLNRVYEEIALKIQYPQSLEGLISGENEGMEAFLHNWVEDIRSKLAPLTGEKVQEYMKTIKGIDSSSYANAVKGAFKSLVSDDEDNFQNILQWLKGEGFDRQTRSQYGILEKLDRTTALRFIRSMAQWIRCIGYSGTMFLFDEGERNISLGTSKERRTAANNLVKLINEASQGRWPGTFFLYSIPHWEQFTGQFGKGGEYVALTQRLERIFSTRNPLAPHIRLEDLTPDDVDKKEFLRQLGKKLWNIFDLAYGDVPEEKLDSIIEQMANVCLRHRGDVSYRRDFVKSFIAMLLELRADPSQTITSDFAEQVFSGSIAKLESAEDSEDEY